MELANFSGVRVLVVGSKGYAASSLRVVLNAAGITKVTIIEDTRRAQELLCSENFEAVFVEDNAMLDGQPFALSARRSTALLNPMIPVFAVYSKARKRDVEKPRDLGVHDVIARPISPKTIQEKLGVAIVAPRPFMPRRNSSAPTAGPSRGSIAAATAAAARPKRPRSSFTKSERSG
jgi:two-component system, chemotaxis family, chemotaxis protein CheY